MRSDNMFLSVLNKYDPNDKRSHGILKFFSEDLTENEKIEFVDSIFKRGSWKLPTEIYNSSNSTSLRKYTEDKFYQIFNNWVSERIKHSSLLSKETKNPYLPQKYSLEFREILFSTRNLNFPIEIMNLFERFIKECNTSYFKKYLEGSFWLVIEEFSTDEIEIFFNYFSSLYIKENTPNLSSFIYNFLSTLAYSHKIFNLSQDFSENLSTLSLSFRKNYNQNNYYDLITILLIELIREKKLILSDSNFNNLIEETINGLEKGNPDNLDLFSFLKRFNYSFINYDFLSEINSFFEKINDNIFKINNSNDALKKAIAHHYIKTSEKYFELFLFYLEHINEEFVTINFAKFVNLIDELRCSFNSLLWFNEFMNFEVIKGDIIKKVKSGYYVKIDESFFKEKIKAKQLNSFYSDEFVSQNGYGFLSDYSIKEFPEIKIFQSSIKKNKLLQISEDTIDNNGHLSSFFIANVNYSASNKGCIITLTPVNEMLKNKISEYNLKSFFSSVDLFMINKAHEYLSLEAPFQKKSIIEKTLFPFKLDLNYRINLSDRKFWELMEQLRPHFYKVIYLNYKRNEESFKNLIAAFENENIITGQVKSKTNGGLFVEVNQQIAFLPGSHIDVKSTTDYDSYIGKIMDFKIIKIDSEFKNIVVSHRVLLEPKYEIQKEQIKSKLDKGVIIEGCVKNITSYGVFIDLGGIDGLIHITDLSWSRINHPNEILELDQKLKVLILDFDLEKTKIQLGLKQLNPHPWNNLDSNLKIGSKVRGKIVSVAEYGAFIEIIGGVEGLIHVSEMCWSNPIGSASDFVKVGDVVDAIVLTLDRDEHKMSLSMKYSKPDPWINVDIKYKLGTKHSSVVKSIADFGVFVELETGVSGLIRTFDLSWIKKISHPSDFVNIGDKLDVIVLDFNINERKLTLGHKQTFRNPWFQNKVLFSVGTIHKGNVLEFFENGARIKLGDHFIGFVFNDNLIKVNGHKLKLGESADFKVIKFNPKAKSIIVSHSDIFRKKKGKSEKI